MRNRDLGLWLVLGSTVAACSNGSDRADSALQLPSDGAAERHDVAVGPDGADAADVAVEGKDAAPDLAPDLTLDLPAERTANGEVGSDVPGEVAGEVGGEVGEKTDGPRDVGLDASMCYWQRQGGGYALPHFTFGLVTPDGQAQRVPSPRGLAVDAGSVWPINDFEGRIVSANGNQLDVDSCLTPATCTPSLYRFTLCGGVGGCVPVTPSLPVGRRVRVVWHLDNEVAFCPGLYFLAVYDAEPGPSHGSLLFVGSGGRNPSQPGSTKNPLLDLPFGTAVEQLACGRMGDAPRSFGDDFAFVFTAKSGGAALRLATGEEGAFELVTPSGSVQRLRMHCLDAVQPNHTDDYWNWDFWGAAEAAPVGLDGGLD